MTSNEAVQASETTESIPKTMKAAVLRDHEVGLEIETLRTPRPKSGEVLIKVAACGLCHSDFHVIGGAIAFPLPAVLGHEVYMLENGQDENLPQLQKQVNIANHVNGLEGRDLPEDLTILDDQTGQPSAMSQTATCV